MVVFLLIFNILGINLLIRDATELRLISQTRGREASMCANEMAFSVLLSGLVKGYDHLNV